MNGWVLISIPYRKLIMTMSTTPTTYRKKWRKSSQSLSKIWRQILINWRGKRLQRRRVNRNMLISRSRMIILGLNNSRRRGIVVLERISELKGSN